MGAHSVDSTGMETGATGEILMGGDAESADWIGVVSGVACVKTTEFCDKTCVEVGVSFGSMDVSYIMGQSRNQTMSDKIKGHTEPLASINETPALASKDISYIIW